MASQERDDKRSPGEDEPMDEMDFKVLGIIDELHCRDDPKPDDFNDKTSRVIE